MPQMRHSSYIERIYIVYILYRSCRLSSSYCLEHNVQTIYPTDHSIFWRDTSLTTGYGCRYSLERAGHVDLYPKGPLNISYRTWDTTTCKQDDQFESVMNAQLSMITIETFLRPEYLYYVQHPTPYATVFACQLYLTLALASGRRGQNKTAGLVFHGSFPFDKNAIKNKKKELKTIFLDAGIPDSGRLVLRLTRRLQRHGLQPYEHL